MLLPARRAFTLVQVIGTLAIIALLSLALAPVVIRRIDQAARDRDKAEMGGLATALQSAILRTGQVPGSSTLVSVVATEMAVSSNQVALNSRKVARSFLIDTNLWIGSTNGQLPYTQSVTPNGTGTNISGVDLPGRNLRLMFLSSLGPALPSSVDFNGVWNTLDGSVPAGWPASWSGKGLDLRIQRVDLTPLFCRLILNPIDTNKFGSFAIESGQVVSSTNYVTTILSNSWYLKGAALRLCDTNNGSAVMEAKTVIQNDTSYVFENLAWRGQFSGWGTNGPWSSPGSSDPSYQGFMTLATTFTNYPTRTGHAGDTTMEILRSYFELMNNYNFWVEEGFTNTQDSAWSILNADEAEFARIMDDSLQ
jgi:type II secretory pathway pseudopilin PulG